MANTDDIAEKVADLLIDQTAKVANTGFDVGKQIAMGAGTMTQKALDKLLKDAKKDKEMSKYLEVEGEISASQMAEIIKQLGLKSSTVTIANSDVQDYERLLREQKVMYAKMNVRDDNAKMFVYLNRDQEKIDIASTIMRANRGKETEIKPNLYFDHIAPENVRLADGLDRAEVELFRHYATHDRFLYTQIRRGDKYAVVYDPKDEEKVRKVMLHVGWDLTGRSGELNREQIGFRLKGITAVSNVLETAERDLYVVCKRSPRDYIVINEDGFESYKNGKKLVSVPRSHPDFYGRCMRAVNGMEGAVVLTENNFRTDLTREELEDYRAIDLFDRRYDELIEMDRQNGLINLVSQKYSLDDEHNATWGLWDTSVSYSEFSGFEDILDDEEREARELEFEHFKKAAFYAQDRFDMLDLHMDEKNLDFVIQKADEKRKSRSGAERTRDREEKEPEKTGPFGL